MARKPRKERASKESRAKGGRRAAKAVPVEEIEEVAGSGGGIDDGIIIATTVTLAIAIVLMITAMQAYSV